MPILGLRITLGFIVFAFLATLSAPCRGAVRLWDTRNDDLTLNAESLSRVFELMEDELILELGSGRHRVEVTDREFRDSGLHSLQGIVDGDSESFFLLSRTDDGATAAFFRLPSGSSHRLIRVDGVYRLEEIESESFLPCAGALEASVSSTARAVSDGPQPARPRGERAEADDGSRHDLLIAWTEKTRAAAGGESQIRAEIQLAVDAANLVYGNSGIASRIRLVHMLETDYDEELAWQYKDHVIALAHPTDGVMDDLHPLRDRTSWFSSWRARTPSAISSGAAASVT